MNKLSLKIENKIFNEVVSNYNLFNKKKLLKKQLVKESKLIGKDSMDILHEFEKLKD